MRECRRLLGECAAPAEIEPDAITVLVTVFQDLRAGKTADAVPVERPTAVMSTAEAVSVALSSGLDAFYYGNKKLTAESVARHLAAAVLKDQADDLAKLRHYFDVVVKERGEKKGGAWAASLMPPVRVREGRDLDRGADAGDGRRPVRSHAARSQVADS